MIETQDEALLRWIPLLPLFGAAVHGALLGLLRRPLSPRFTVLLSCGAPALSFALSFVALTELVGQPAGRFLVDELTTWIAAGDFSAELAFQLDPLSAALCMVVTGVGTLVHLHAAAGMQDDDREDRGFQRFFCLMNGLLFAMLVLVLADNLVLCFLGWQVLGLCSSLLIGFWYADAASARAGTRAFLVARLGDFGFLTGSLLLFWGLWEAGDPSVSFRAVEAALPALAEQSLALPGWLQSLSGREQLSVTTVAALAFLLAAVGRSAQLPLHGWLADAASGPLPAAALIHTAATTIAGVYLLCRLSFLYSVEPGVSALLAWLGVGSALLAGLVAVVQTDITKVLSWATLGQLGLMFLAVGSGAYSAALFHLVTHAFFQALLFLAAGSVSLALHQERDTDRMGGLRHMLPITHACFAVGVAAVAGAPFLSGWFSRDAVLIGSWLAAGRPGHVGLYALALLGTGLATLALCRLHFRTFLGLCRAPVGLRDRIREPGWLVTGPLLVLATLALFGGWLGPPAAFNPFPVADADSNSLANVLAPVLRDLPQQVAGATRWRLAGAATAVSALAAGLAWWLYVAQPLAARRLAGAFGPLRTLVERRFFLDEAVERGLLRPALVFSSRVLDRGIERGLVDGLLVEGGGRAVRRFAERLRRLQSGLAPAYLLWMLLGAAALVGWAAR